MSLIEQTNESLLDISKRNLRIARNVMKAAEDEGDLNISAYLVQQSVELALKHYIEVVMGEEYPYTHDIGSLVDIVGTDTFPEVYPWSGTITLMESKTRYIKNYRLSKKVIDDVMGISDRLITQIENKEQERKSNIDINETNTVNEPHGVYKPKGR